MSTLPLLPKPESKDANQQLAEDLSNLQIPQDIQLSPNGAHKVLYSTSFDWGHSPEKNPLSTLWLATTGHANSSRKLTSGRFNDINPRWSPDGSLVAFISDREAAGKSKAIYVIPMLEGGAEPSPITEAGNKSDFETFSFSPNGKEILYFSADELPEARAKAEEDEVSGPQVWDEEWPYARLRIADVQAKTTRCLTEGINRHVMHAAWSHDGQQIVFVSAENSHIEEPYITGLTISTLDLASRQTTDHYNFCGELDELHWPADGKIYFRAAAPLDNVNGGQAIYRLDPSVSSPKTPEKLAYGVDEDATKLLFRSGEALVSVAHGMTSSIRLLASGKQALAHASDIEAWDAGFSRESDELILAAALSDPNTPDEVYTTTASGGALVQLSNHGAVFQGRKFGSAQRIACRSDDDEADLEALFLTPANPRVPADKPQPTFVMVHGGPYDRNCAGFNSYYYHWAPYILAQGYSILMPQYRGSSGRGEEFGLWSCRGAGVYDHADVISLTDAAVRSGQADPARLLVGGWSQGGFLSYLCGVRNGLQGLGWKFQAAVPGAGVCDTDVMALTSDNGSTLEPQLNGGRAPWLLRADDTRNRVASPLWYVQAAVDAAKEKGEFVIPPMLILHGEKDERCPLSQGEGFRRALRAHGLPYEFVVYPRQPHLLTEQRARVDILLRIGRWCDTYIGQGLEKP